ncbi:Uncharacterised protein [Neisseria meningitidis]|nr:Uncharacterised protein [Neisseria meningitidis]
MSRLLLNVGTQSGWDYGVGEDTVFVNVFGRVESLHIVIVQTAYDNGNFAAQVHHFFQNAIHAAVFGKRGFEFIQCFYADLAFAVIAQSGSFQDAGQKLYAFFSDVFGSANCLIRRGLQACFAYPCLFLNAVLCDGNAVAAGGNIGVFGEKTHRIGIDVFELGRNSRTFCQFFQSGLVVKRRTQMAVGKFRCRRIRVGIEYGYFVAHGFGSNSKHSA